MSISWHHGVSATRPACYCETHSERCLSPFPLFPVFLSDTDRSLRIPSLHSKLGLSPQTPPTTLSLLTFIAKDTALSLLLELPVLGSCGGDLQITYPLCLPYSNVFFLSLSFSSQFLNSLINKQGYEHTKGDPGLPPNLYQLQRTTEETPLRMQEGTISRVLDLSAIED